MTHIENSSIDFDPIKKCWKIGDIIIVAIDKLIVKGLEVNENDTFLQQEVTDKGDILMRIKRI